MLNLSLSLQQNNLQLIVSLDGTIVMTGTVAQQTIWPAEIPPAIIYIPSYSIEDGALRVDIRVLNTGNVAYGPLAFNLPPVAINANAATGTMSRSEWSGVAANLDGMLWPSQASPLGCTYLTDGNLTVSGFSSTEGRFLLNSPPVDSNAGTSPGFGLPLQYWSAITVQPGASVDLSVILQITKDASRSARLDAWQKHLPKRVASSQPISLALYMTAVNAAWITPTDPLGYDSPAQRDLSNASTATIYTASAMALLYKLRGNGEIFWQPGGMQPAHPEIWTSDTIGNISQIQSNWDTIIVPGFHSQNRNIGVMVRADNPQFAATMATLMATPIDWYYIDSGGADAASIAAIRSLATPFKRFFTEHTTDYTMAFADVYCEWNGSNLVGLTTDQMADLQYIWPQATWLCRDTGGKMTRADFTAKGFTPLIADDCIWNGLPAGF